MDKPIELDPNELLGLCQVLRVSDEQANVAKNSRLLSKVGGEVDDSSPSTRINARLFGKIGETETD